MPPKSTQAGSTDLARATAELDQARERAVVSLGAVAREVSRTLDWRGWVRRRPAAVLAAAFALGAFLGRRRD